jgi:DNA-binding MarR family transcriptional regulator
VAIVERGSQPAREASNDIAGLPPALTGQTGFLLSTLGRASRDAVERALAPLEIKPQHFGVLVILESLGPVPQRVVGDRLHIDKSSMTMVIDHLERLDLLRRRRNPDNRRAYELTLTAAGREAIAAALPHIEQVECVTLSPLDAGERAQLHALLLKMLAGAAPVTRDAVTIDRE